MPEPPTSITEIALVCALITVTRRDRKHRKSIVERDITGCRYAPELMADRGIVWSNIFRELARARACGVKPFRISEECNG